MLRELTLTLLSWLVICPSAFLAGSFYRPFIRVQDTVMRGILYYALGFATLSYGTLALSAVRLLNPFGVWCLLSLPFLRWGGIKEWMNWFPELFSSFQPGPNRMARLLLWLSGLMMLCLLAGSLSPEIGGDALTYQLNLPKRFLQQASLAPDFLDYNSYFPLLVNNLYLIGLATGGVFSAKLFHFFFGILLYTLVAKAVLEITRNRGLSVFVALTVFLTPTIYNTLSTAYIDVALAFYTLAALWMFLAAIPSGEGRWFFASGLLAGCGIAIKYLSLLSTFAIAAVGFCQWIVTWRSRFWARALICFVLGVFVACGYWLIRNWTDTGNPFFPYWGGLFGVESRPPSNYSALGLGHSALHYLSLYFNMFLVPEAFGTFPTRIGIFYFLFLPFVLIGTVADRNARGYGIFWFALTTVMFFMAQADRWMLPVLPIMAVAAAGGIHWTEKRLTSCHGLWAKRVAGLIACLALVFYAGAGIYHYRFAYLLYVGKLTPETYIRSFERTADVSSWANRNLPSDAKILAEFENRLFYFDRPVVRQVFLSWRYANTDPQTLPVLAQRLGITHYLTADPMSGDHPVPRISKERKALMGAGVLREVYRGESRNIRDARYLYRIYRIGRRP